MMKKFENRLPWNLDWNLLRSFMVIVEQGGITPAANYLGRKQPTISNALKRLEETFGQQLLDRKPNYFEVTPAGQTLYKEAEQIFGAVSRLPELLEDASEMVTGHISLAMASHVVYDKLDQALGEFAQRFPKVTYSINIHTSKEILQSIAQKKYAVGICLVGNNQKNLLIRPIYTQYFGFFCGPTHPLFGRKNIPLSALHDEDYVSFQTDHETGPLHAVSLMRTQAKLNPNFRGVSSSLQEVRRMIISGIGIGPLPLHIAKRDVDEGNLWQLPPYEQLPPIQVHLVTNPNMVCSNAENRFIDHLRTQLADETLLVC
ncbi:MAG: LysR family transcriptional regulator [Alphaproteobacteria bacterium]|nr:LysR family transcriptional regulator [Alphaproteobacteria bacterium]